MDHTHPNPSSGQPHSSPNSLHTPPWPRHLLLYILWPLSASVITTTFILLVPCCLFLPRSSELQSSRPARSMLPPSICASPFASLSPLSHFSAISPPLSSSPRRFRGSARTNNDLKDTQSHQLKVLPRSAGAWLLLGGGTGHPCRFAVSYATDRAHRSNSTSSIKYGMKK